MITVAEILFVRNTFATPFSVRFDITEIYDKLDILKYRYSYSHNPLEGYMSEVIGYDNTYLGPVEIVLLERFAKEKLSAYKIYSVLKAAKQISAYKNVHKRVKRLRELGLIAETRYPQDHFETYHGAIYYQITSKGIFYLIYSPLSQLNLRDLMKYRNDVILNTLLFPFFEESTLERHTVRVFYAIVLYLFDCCETTLRAVKEIRGEQDPAEREKKIKSLMYDLRQNAFAMAFKLIRKFNPRPLGYLARDKKFTKLVQDLHEEFETGYERFVSEIH